MPEGSGLKQKLYEAMFLIDAAKGGSGLPALIRHIVELLEQHEAQTEQIEKWGDRKLAYDIRGVERGIYVLVFFRADPSRIAGLRRAINLSEDILRILILQADKVVQPVGELLSRQGEPVAAKPAPPAGAPAGADVPKEPEAVRPEQEAVVSAEPHSDSPQE